MICIKRAWSESISLAASARLRRDGFDHFAALRYAGYDVRFRRMRYVTLFLAAMFFASNAAAAIRACVADLAGQGSMVAHALDAHADESAGKPLCPPSDDAGPCLKHFAQNHQSDDQKIWTESPAAALVPAPAVLHVVFRAPAKLVVAATVPPVVGPSLTILYRNFRN